MLQGVQTQVSIGSADNIVAQANNRRRSVVISADGNATMGVIFGVAAAANKGIMLTPTNPVVKLSYLDIGEMVEREIHVWSNEGGKFVTIIESIEVG
jgi:hypothetical protein